MTLWWHQPEWKSAACMCCGANIWDSGGDPDHGRCMGCMMEHLEGDDNQPRPECEICGKGEACAGSNGYDVCSEQCANEAKNRPAKETQ